MGKRTPILEAHEFFRRGKANAEGWSQLVGKGRAWESFYRERWQHDKVVRSTHGVNCTGSCSWNVYVKDGLITWETQAVDYPRNGPDRPDHEPRGCPRAAYKEARKTLEPVEAFAQVAGDGGYRGERGRGGFVRATWDEATELI